MNGRDKERNFGHLPIRKIQQLGDYLFIDQKFILVIGWAFPQVEASLGVELVVVAQVVIAQHLVNSGAAKATKMLVVALEGLVLQFFAAMVAYLLHGHFQFRHADQC